LQDASRRFHMRCKASVAMTRACSRAEIPRTQGFAGIVIINTVQGTESSQPEGVPRAAGGPADRGPRTGENDDSTTTYEVPSRGREPAPRDSGWGRELFTSTHVIHRGVRA